MIDTRLIVDSIMAGRREAHENNVIGTMNILAACGGPDSPVRKVVFKSSAHYYGCERDDPAFFTEDMRRPHPPRTPIERDIVEAERAVSAFGERNPDKVVTVLRFANGLGPDLTTSHTRLLSLPARAGHPRLRPALPVHRRGRHPRRARPRGPPRPPRRLQRGRRRRARALRGRLAARQADRARAAAVGNGRRGVACCAAPASGSRPRCSQQLRYGRGLDNRRLKAAGYHFGATTRETVQAFAEHQRVRRLREGEGEGYRYEREVEEFLRWSPAVRGRRGARARAA